MKFTTKIYREIKVFVLLMCGLATLLPAHNDLEQSILLLSQEIETHPDSTELYLRRGELYTHHEQYKKAIRDFKTCKRKGNKTAPLYLALAKCYHEQNKNYKALDKLDELLNKNPKQIQALRMKGNILMDQKEYDKAARALELVLQLAKEPLVENYLEAAEAYSECKEKSTQEIAFRTLEKGIDDLGPLLLFYENMKGMAMRNQDYLSAIKYQTEIINHSIRKEKPYYVRALLYNSLREKGEALKDLITAQKMLKKLPPRFQKTKAMKELKQQIKTLKLEIE
ncbi:MAG: tetratricopeptide repeat protein [Saprospiraceae bacterium]